MARFAMEDELQGYKDNGYSEFESPLGTVLIPLKEVQTEDAVVLDLNRFLWMTAITMEGARLAS